MTDIHARLARVFSVHDPFNTDPAPIIRALLPVIHQYAAEEYERGRHDVLSANDTARVEGSCCCSACLLDALQGSDER